jgi:hypothetical protein
LSYVFFDVTAVVILRPLQLDKLFFDLFIIIINFGSMGPIPLYAGRNYVQKLGENGQRSLMATHVRSSYYLDCIMACTVM